MNARFEVGFRDEEDWGVEKAEKRKEKSSPKKKSRKRGGGYETCEFCGVGRQTERSLDTMKEKGPLGRLRRNSVRKNIQRFLICSRLLA